MVIPPGLESATNKGPVCMLKKSLYGLKQSSRAWFERFTRAGGQGGFAQCQSNHTMFVNMNQMGS